MHSDRSGRNENKNVNTIVLGDVALSVLGKWWLILLVALTFGSIAWVYTDATYVDTYASYGSIYLVSKSSDEVFQTPEVSYAKTMMEDYIYRVSTEENMRAAVQRLPDELRAVYADANISEEELEAYIEKVTAGMSWSSLQSATTITNPENTHYLYIRVVSTDPKLAYAAASAVLGASLENLSDFFGVKEVSIDEQPRLSSQPVSAKSNRLAYMAALLGAALIIAILVLLYLLDDKINTSEDIEQYLGLTVLAMIPVYEADEKDGRNAGGRREYTGS